MNSSMNGEQPDKRFAFGDNWSKFLGVVDEGRVEEAEKSLKKILGYERLDGLKFLDIGSGSGLFSLAARRLGAQVRSFDYDEQSVATTIEMQRIFSMANDKKWLIEQGSVLDDNYIKHLGQFDIVYSWGVLHHTGDMWRAMQNIIPLVRPGGYLFIAIYNDQGWQSELWRWVKRIYCSGRIGRWLVMPAFSFIFVTANFLKDIRVLRNPLQRYKNYRIGRGMSLIRDLVDWLGGYPYEVATPERIIDFYKSKGFVLTKIIQKNTLGCNEFVFRARVAKDYGDAL